MKYHRIYIHTDGTLETYNEITQLLGVIPEPIDTSSRFSKGYSTWTYSVDTSEEDGPFDFINIFLDLLESKFAGLEKLGVNKNTDILFWLLYEYDRQCALEFHPEEMKRLGQSGVHLNIDCWAN